MLGSRSVGAADCRHGLIAIKGRHPIDWPGFRRIIMSLDNRNINLLASLRIFTVDQWPRRNLDGYCFRFNCCFVIVIGA